MIKASSAESSNGQITDLEEEVRRLKKINRVLIERVERSGSLKSAPYVTFENSVILGELVRERTRELNLSIEKTSIQ